MIKKDKPREEQHRVYCTEAYNTVQKPKKIILHELQGRTDKTQI